VKSDQHVWKSVFILKGDVLNSYLMFRFHEIAAKSKDDLVALGFPHFTVEDFHDTVSV
jgi:hypothetical protein